MFGDRYRSEAVEDDSYLLTVYRYILREPEKAGIGKASEYRWSSYALYGEKESKVIRRQLGGQSGTALQGMEKSGRDEALRKLKKADLTVRQIERLTGISHGIVQRA